jgi:hypothetical protein
VRGALKLKKPIDGMCEEPLSAHLLHNGRLECDFQALMWPVTPPITMSFPWLL